MREFMKAVAKLAAIIWAVTLLLLAAVACLLIFRPEALWQGIRYGLIGVCILGGAALILPLVRLLFR